MINKTLNNEKGFALVAALIVMILLVGLGGTSMIMSQMGYKSIGSERKYQLANWSAESGLMAGVQSVINTAVCPTTSVSNSSEGFTYWGVQDASGSYCFLKAIGTRGSASVIKTVVVPNAGNTWAGLVTKGGTINLAGSSAIAGCDDDETSYADKCGVLPAVITNPGQLTAVGSSTTLSACQNEGTLQGYSGKPPIQATETLPADLTPRYFVVSDADGNGSTWDDLLEKIETHYTNTTTTGTWRKIEFYDQTKPTTRYGLPVDSAGAGLAPSAPNSGSTCDPSFTVTPLCCRTTSATEITCYSDSNCTGALTPSGQASAPINLAACKQTQDASNSANYPYIAVNDNTVSYIKINPAATSNKINTSTKFEIAHSGHRIALTNNYGSTSDYVKIDATVNNTRIYTGGSLTISSALSTTSGNAGSIIYAGGNVTFGANVGNHGSDSCDAATSGTDPMYSSSNIIAGGNVTITSQNIKNTNIFANNISMSSQPDIEGGKANVFYALNNLTINTNGAPCFGYPCNNDDDVYPVMILVGDGNPATGGSSISAPGNLTISGMIYTDATNVDITGAVELQGTLVNISTNTTINNTGNGTIQFNKKVLDGLYSGMCSSIMNEPKCGGGNKQGYISNTKTTMY